MNDALAALTRAIDANIAANPHAPIHLGHATTFQGQHVQQLVMMKPCRRQPVAAVLLMASTAEAALLEAARFVSALVKPQDEDHEGE